MACRVSVEWVFKRLSPAGAWARRRGAGRAREPIGHDVDGGESAEVVAGGLGLVSVLVGCFEREPGTFEEGRVQSRPLEAVAVRLKAEVGIVGPGGGFKGGADHEADVGIHVIGHRGMSGRDRGPAGGEGPLKR